MPSALSRDSISTKIVQGLPLTFLERRYWLNTSAVIDAAREGITPLTGAQLAELDVRTFTATFNLAAMTREEIEGKFEEQYLNRPRNN